MPGVDAATLRTGRAVVDLIGELVEDDVPMLVIVDQFLTYAALASVETIGLQETAKRLRKVAATVEAGGRGSEELTN